MTEPPAPETLFAEYRALAARADATLADWQALQKRVRSAKAAGTSRWHRLFGFPRDEMQAEFFEMTSAVG